MNKCDFCTKSTPDGKCYWTSLINRERDCEKAIQRMTEALKNVGYNQIKNKQF